MRLVTTLALAAALFTAPAFASNTTTFPSNPYYSTGTMENFRELYVDPDKFVGGLEPVAPLEGEVDGPAQLRIMNDTIGFLIVTVNGVEVGVLTPMIEGVINGVKPGQYEVVIEMPNKLRTTYRLSTTAAPEAEAAPEAAPAASE
jgi:hypothetical protein